MTEFFDVLTIDRRPVGRTVARGTTLGPGEYHLVVQAIITNPEGRVLLTRRSPNKIAGGKWECTAGSVRAGESSRDAMVREICEEVGIEVAIEDAAPMGFFVEDDALFDVWRVHTTATLSDLVLDPAEVDDATFATLDDIEALVGSGQDTESLKEVVRLLRAEYRASPLYQRYAKALGAFLETLDVGRHLSVLVCGSFAQDRLRPGSDLDVVLLLPPDSPEREDFREVWSDGVQVQLFGATEAELNASFDWERRTLTRQKSSLVAHGVCVAGDQVAAQRVVAAAQAAWSAEPPPLEAFHAQSMINFIENQVPEAMDQLYDQSPIGFLMTWNGMMDKYFHLIHQCEGRLLPRHGAMDAELSSIADRELGRAFCAALSAEGLADRKRLFYALSLLIKDRLKALVDSNSRRIV